MNGRWVQQGLKYTQSFRIVLHLSSSWKLYLLSHVLVNEASLQLLFMDNSYYCALFYSSLNSHRFFKRLKRPLDLASVCLTPQLLKDTIGFKNGYGNSTTKIFSLYQQELLKI